MIVCVHELGNSCVKPHKTTSTFSTVLATVLSILIFPESAGLSVSQSHPTAAEEAAYHSLLSSLSLNYLFGLDQ